MRKSKTLARLRANEAVRICGLGHFIPAFIRHAAHFGYDSIWLDLEHRVMEDREVQALLSFFHQFDIDCMLRASTLEKTRLYRYLEDGATGLMIPHVSTAEKAQMLVDSIKFPPIGDRGFDGAGLDSDFILEGGFEYTEKANDETFLIVQIETLQAVENVEEITAVNGVDGVFVGPADLSLRIEKSGTDLTLDQAIDRVASACKNNGKAWGIPCPNAERLQHYHNLGAQLLAHGGEFWAFMQMLEECSQTLDDILK